MKKLLLALTVTVTLIACGGNNDKQKTAAGTDTETTTDDFTKNPDYQKGLDLVANNDCFTCHQIDQKLTGPSYKDVAIKYAGADDKVIGEIAARIINGGSGIFGDIPMTPHPGLSEDDAKAMVKYILLLK